jgi:hypothetical protein
MESVMYFECENSYGKVKKGQRFEVKHNSTRHINASKAEGLAKATGITLTEANSHLTNLKLKQI